MISLLFKQWSAQQVCEHGVKKHFWSDAEVDEFEMMRNIKCSKV